MTALLGIPAGYQILFLQGGASTQFAMVPMNLLPPGQVADYTNSGAWASKAIKEAKLIVKYPLRIAINPFVSSVGWILPALVSGTVITSVVLDLPTVGPLFLQSLRSQDMALAGGLVMVMGMLTIIGTLISDILLAIVDPRIRYG